MTINLYSTGCPKCKVLKSKLDSKGIEYNVISDIDIMTSKGIDTVPVLEVNGEMLNFKTSMNWVEEYTELKQGYGTKSKGATNV